jgi:hypothetical protein
MDVDPVMCPVRYFASFLTRCTEADELDREYWLIQ